MDVPKFELIEAQRIVLLEDFELPNNQYIYKKDLSLI